jgi:hypothetical protein
LGIWVGNWWVGLAAIGLFGVWLSELRIAVVLLDGHIVVQNFVRQYEIERDDVAYVEGKIRWRQTPRFVLTTGRTVPVVAYSDFWWQPGVESKDAWGLARALQVPYRVG